MYLQINKLETKAGNFMWQTNVQPGFFYGNKKLLNFIDNYLNIYQNQNYPAVKKGSGTRFDRLFADKTKTDDPGPTIRQHLRKTTSYEKTTACPGNCFNAYRVQKKRTSISSRDNYNDTSINSESDYSYIRR